MARLNDPPPPPTESIDALKRRFIRQNREIARVNSTQSQRIRNLETEVTRLVAENVAWREQAIAAKSEAERWRRTNSVSEEILNMKEKLQSKVKEVSLLLAEMGELPEKAARKAKRKSRIQTESIAEQDWKHRLSMREAAVAERDMHDGRLPAILEDKLYPRRTLESAEITALRNEEAMQQASESPELGPPPVAHFDVNDAISFDNPRRSLDGNSEDVAQLPPTLEKRRKRRTSALLQDMSIEDSSEPEKEKATPLLLKSGAKRKLDVSELEEPVLQLSENDDFVFQRRQEPWTNAAATGKKPSRFTRAPGRENDKPVEATVQSSPQKPAERKILAPKSTNSPAKRRVRVAQKLEVVKDDEQEKPSVKLSRRLNIPPPLEAQEIVLEPEKEAEPNGLPPKTPAVLEDDVLSPISTEPSARTHQTKEAAISNSVEDVLNGSIGRGSRRSRPAVSYALPNLRDKMRRPTKDLVGAVEGIEKSRDSGARTSIRGTSDDPGNSDDPQSMDEEGLRIKHDKPASEEARWKGLPLNKKEEPTSPLRDKERKEVTRLDKSNAKSEQKHESRQSYGDELEKAVDRLSIFDPPVSSPMEEPQEQDARTSKRKSTTNLLSRRHSIQSSASDAAVETSTKDNPGPLLTSRLNPTSRAPPPRPSSAASLRQNSSSSRATGLKRSSSINSNVRPAGIDGSTTSSNSIAPSTERASRRRSMMV
ncbi:hypothetical protein LTR47_003611 [Exophiala xenobiotica]|nr:hypothetical protein LTR92_008099 [Exophiala xenobiotica]KAK5208023.1 hypothetical protein LTR41_006535 [Exophiala xenobiotica]KAK5235426.1 hypothetical protein LTR47_003611 [Exophiala xenobiotica]KAK5245222.1 hypothetical protein LTS06_009317 [Exophiala xenobiotica]KAK5321418.1 hypothetical protein LTR93_006661 [Exophiala xenobiotica]